MDTARTELQKVLDKHVYRGDTTCMHGWRQNGMASNVLYKWSPAFQCVCCGAESIPPPHVLEPFYIDQPTT